MPLIPYKSCSCNDLFCARAAEFRTSCGFQQIKEQPFALVFSRSLSFNARMINGFSSAYTVNLVTSIIYVMALASGEICRQPSEPEQPQVRGLPSWVFLRRDAGDATVAMTVSWRDAHPPKYLKYYTTASDDYYWPLYTVTNATTTKAELLGKYLEWRKKQKMAMAEPHSVGRGPPEVRFIHSRDVVLQICYGIFIVCCSYLFLQGVAYFSVSSNPRWNDRGSIDLSEQSGLQDDNGTTFICRTCHAGSYQARRSYWRSCRKTQKNIKNIKQNIIDYFLDTFIYIYKRHFSRGTPWGEFRV